MIPLLCLELTLRLRQPGVGDEAGTWTVPSSQKSAFF
jgi:hypothetical protein